MAAFSLSLVFDIITQIALAALSWGWILVVMLVLWIIWEVYIFIKRIDYVSAIQMTFLEITIPEEATQTPKAMEQAFEVWSGIHKNPDLIERYFDGYMLAWYSCEIVCQRNEVHFVIVVPTVHRKFFEGVLYGQYPAAEIKETADYTQQFLIADLEKTWDMYGSEIIMEKDDYYPLRTYREYEDTLGEDDKYIDPLQAVVEAFTTCEEGEHYWFQLLVKPIDSKKVAAWAETGNEKILKLAGREKTEAPGFLSNVLEIFLKIPGELLQVVTGGTPAEAEKERKERFFMNPYEQEEAKGILLKISRGGYKTKMRVIHIAPAGKLHKPNISKTIGVFKQFNTFHLNQIKPDPNSKTNGPNYILKATRRNYRKRRVFVDYVSRDFWGDESGQMMSAEELASFFHIPGKYGRAPSIKRATAGIGSAPDNLPYT